MEAEMSRFHPDELLICSTVSLATAAQSKESAEFSNFTVPVPTEPMSLWDILVVRNSKKKNQATCVSGANTKAQKATSA